MIINEKCFVRYIQGQGCTFRGYLYFKMFAFYLYAQSIDAVFDKYFDSIIKNYTL